MNGWNITPKKSWMVYTYSKLKSHETMVSVYIRSGYGTVKQGHILRGPDSACWTYKPQLFGSEKSSEYETFIFFGLFHVNFQWCRCLFGPFFEEWGQKTQVLFVSFLGVKKGVETHCHPTNNH